MLDYKTVFTDFGVFPLQNLPDFGMKVDTLKRVILLGGELQDRFQWPFPRGGGS